MGWVVGLAFSPDGKTLANGDAASRVHLWEVETLARRALFTGHRDGIHGVAFSPDSRRLVSASVDTTVLVWDLTGRASGVGQRTDAAHLTAKELDSLWEDLGASDAAKAHAALWKLALAPGAAKGLKERLRPGTGFDAERFARLVRDLDDDNFKVRLKATQELEKMGDAIAAELRKVLGGKVSAEVRWRVEYLLEQLEKPTPGRLRQLRAVEALERAGTPEARAVLEVVSKGPASVRLTREAKAALKRLGQ
jgi:hypothetical protein